MKYLICILFSFLCFTPCANALSIVRDTEVESVLNGYARKIFTAGGLDPANAEVVLINDNSINAFVAGGQTIFVHTGLITNATSVDDVTFVLSHETGHIIGGHVIRGIEQLKNARSTALISTVLGGLVAAAGGRPDAGMAVMMGGQGSALGLYLSYRQVEESSADRTAVDIMNKTGYSLVGFSNTMRKIKQSERLNAPQEAGAYLNTHPVTKDRIRDMERFTANAKPATQDVAFEMIRAKLIGFLYPPKKTREIYQDDALPDKYALAIALYRDKKIPQSLQKIDELITLNPNNPFFYELKGQFLFETGRVDEAVSTYEKAVDLLPRAPLIRLALGQALTESEQKQASEKAVFHLSRVVTQDAYIPEAWRLLAIAQGKNKNIPMADYAMAEYYQLIGNTKESRRLAERAMKTVPENSSAYLHLQDILATSKKQ